MQTAADPREMQDKRRIRTWVKRFEEDDKYTRTHNHQGAGEVRHLPSAGPQSVGTRLLD
jgi:hypothetical protein